MVTRVDTLFGDEHYVDPSIDADSGSGTVGDPYGDLQYALDQNSRTTLGEIFWVKAGTAEVLTASLDFATRGNNAAGAPIVIAGYTSSRNDGGIAAIDASTYQLVNDGSQLGMVFLNMDLYGSVAASTFLLAGSYCGFVNCHVYRTGTPTTARLVELGTGSKCFNSLFSDGVVYDAGSSCFAYNVFLARDQTSYSPAQLLNLGTKSAAYRNVFLANFSGDCDGIHVRSSQCVVRQNSVYASTGQTGSGIYGATTYSQYWMNNLVQGYDGVGGQGYERVGSGAMLFVGNVGFDNTTNFADATDNHVDAKLMFFEDNEDAEASPFVDAASDDLSPADVGNVAQGAWPSGGIGRGWVT